MSPTPRSTVLQKLTVKSLIYSRNPAFIEPKGSLPCTQQPTIGPYPEPDKPTPNLPKIHSNISTSSELSLPFTCRDQNVVRISHCSHARYMPHPSRPSFHYPNNIWWNVEFRKLLIMQSSPASRHFLLLGTLFSYTLNLCSSLSMRNQVSHPHKIIAKIIVLHYVCFQKSFTACKNNRYLTCPCRF
jgi:hypothetical protein